LSTYADRSYRCACGAENKRRVAEGLNVARSTKPRDAIILRTFQRFACETCARTTVIEDAFTLMDFLRKQFFVQEPPSLQPRWREREVAVRALADRTLAPEALPPVVQDIGEGLRVRIVFGLEALREKLVCFDAALDDVALEACKLELVRRGHSLDVELRLDEVQGDVLVLRAGDDASMRVPRRDYDAVLGDAYAPVREELARGAYVDLARLLPV
jgi:hypothetical protein